MLCRLLGVQGFDVSPDGNELWTASSENGNISIIDLGAKKQSTQIDAKVNRRQPLKFTPDGKQVFISSLQSGDLTVYDVASRKEIKKLNLGHGAAGILMDTDGSRAFVACSADNYIAIVDLKTLQVIGHWMLAACLMDLHGQTGNNVMNEYRWVPCNPGIIGC